MTAAALPLSGAAAPDRYKYKYLIAITVSLASVLELLDTSIVNVAIPHMMGNLGATLDQIAWVSTGYIVANVIVLPITGWLSAYFGRQRYFAGSIALFTLLSFINDSLHQERAESVDWLGLGLLAIGVGSLQIMLERGERLDWWASSQIRLLAVASVVSLVTFIWHELRTEHPVVDLRILKSRQLAGGGLFGLVLGGCLFATVFVLPVYLQTIRDFTSNQPRLVIHPSALASAFTMGFMGRL